MKKEASYVWVEPNSKPPPTETVVSPVVCTADDDRLTDPEDDWEFGAGSCACRTLHVESQTVLASILNPLRDWRVQKKRLCVTGESGSVDLGEELRASRWLGGGDEDAVRGGKCLGQSETQGAGRRLCEGYTLEGIDAGKGAANNSTIVNGDGRAGGELSLVDRRQGGSDGGQDQNEIEEHLARQKRETVFDAAAATLARRCARLL